MNNSGKTLSQGKLGPRPRGLGCFLTGAVLFLCLLVFVFGLGLPYTYWLEISEVQAFEGGDGVVLFVEVQRTMRYGGAWQEPPIDKTIELLRIEVSPGGHVTRSGLKFVENMTFNTNVAPVVKTPDGFYLVTEPSIGRPFCQLHRVEESRIKSLNFEDSDRLLREVGLRCGGSRPPYDFDEVDRVTQRGGWRRLNRDSYRFKYDAPISSGLHKLRLKFVEGDQSQAVVAESSPGPSFWSRTLVEVSTERRMSYRDPSR